MKSKSEFAKRFSRSLLLLASASVLSVAAWMLLVDPRLNDWGAEAQEIITPLPGDDWVPAPSGSRTRAITIHATPAQVWPWLMQMGAGRGGFYTFDLIERTRTRDHSAMKRLDASLRAFRPGDDFVLAKGLALKVVRVETAKHLVIGSPDAEPHAWSWSFVLEPGPLQSSRLLVRERFGPPGSLPLRALNRLVASVDNLMTWKMLKGIRARAEAEAGV